jgi:exodeoxyribonuclease VII small subunit
MPATDPEKMTYEQAIEELESIVDRIEQGQIGLQESLAEYRRGAALLKRCRGILDVAEQQIEKLTAEEAEEPQADT